MSKLSVSMLGNDKHPVEVLVVDGGKESSVAVLEKQGDSAVVEVAAPQAVVLRQLPGTEATEVADEPGEAAQEG